jgi:hypothetical protein
MYSIYDTKEKTTILATVPKVSATLSVVKTEKCAKGVQYSIGTNERGGDEGS